MDRRVFLRNAGAACYGMLGSEVGLVPSRRRPTVLDAPSNLGLKPPLPGREPGVRYMPAVLRKHGLLSRLHAEDSGEVVPPPYKDIIDSHTKVRNAEAIHNYSVALADRVGQLLDRALFPIVLGGDCSILLGSALALRRRGRFGLLFVDGHTDLLTSQTSATGGAAGMDLALATGTGPALLTAIDGLAPYIRPADVVLFGYRWPGPKEESPAKPVELMTAFSLETVRHQGAAHAAEKAIACFDDRSFWMHVDLDVLSPEWMPAVDSPDPGGMNPTELLAIVRAGIRSKRCVGMEITIYDPTLDPGERRASLVVDLLVNAFKQ
jgi:arginase